VRRTQTSRPHYKLPLLIGLTALCAAALALMGVAARAGAVPLPDGRVYELVTPLGNENADVYRQPSEVGNGAETELLFEAAADGDAVTYAGSPTSGGSGSSGFGAGNQYLATRLPDGGWTQSSLSPPGTTHSGGTHTGYEAFSSDLSVGIISEVYEQTPLSSEVNAPLYPVLYAHDLEGGVYRPFFTEPPLDRSPFEFYSVSYETPGTGFSGLMYAGSSTDLDHLLFEANDAMRVNPHGGVMPVDGGESENNLYDSVDSELQSVNVLPDGSSEPNATFGAPRFRPTAESEEPDLAHAISADGSRIFWTSLEGTGNDETSKALYVRENDAQPQSPLSAEDECLVASDACTVQVDASTLPGTKKEQEEGGGEGRFWTASSDGSRVFFTDCRRLTDDSTSAPHSDCGELSGTYGGEESTAGNDLYEYDVPTGQLTDLTVDRDASDPYGADVQGVVGASENGEYVYFIADGVLASGATGGQPNLYLRHGGATILIATLVPGDGFEGGPFVGGGNRGDFGDWWPGLGERTAQVTPDGHSVVFVSTASLIGYHNEGAFEVYVYDTGNGGRLSCVSCDPGGAPPPVGGSGAAGYVAAGGYVPVSNHATYTPRTISEDGDQVFFDSAEPLVPQASDRVENVYEWERAGTPGGSCPEGAPNGGCVYLLSGGTSSEGSYLLDASSSGDDVFMITRAQLVPQDLDENEKVYDVRVNGVAAVPSPACSGSGCQGAPGSPPVFATPASVTFNGVGNFSPPSPAAVVKPKVPPRRCAKGKTRDKRGTCVKRKAGKNKRKGHRPAKGRR
jgi:hypothetical protein